MKIKVVTISPYDSITAAHKLMKTYNIRHLLVTDGGELKGVISDRDIMRVADIDSLGVLHTPNQTADQIMSENPITVGESASVEEVTQIMLDSNIDCLPVVDGNQIKGLVTSYDMLHLVNKLAKEGKCKDLAFQFVITEGEKI